MESRGTQVQLPLLSNDEPSDRCRTQNIGELQQWLGGKDGSSSTNHHPNGIIVDKRPNVTLTHLPRRPPVDIEFTDLSYSIREERKKGVKSLLKCINGTFLCGELTAIMGPSGAGKSTLMNILAGYKTSNVNGSIMINGKQRNLRKFRKLSCYIMQEDCLQPHLTVDEAMHVSANLKLGKDVSEATKKMVIKEITETIGLVDASDTRTVNLSGGQRKRLSIALELVNNPPVMFFDEPTSGLDSSSCFQCISLLKSLSRGGRTVICTIHQPSARLFEMFDFLYTLADGQCIYKGLVSGLVPFLSSMGLHCPSYHNPADYVMEVATGEHGNWLEKLVVSCKKRDCIRNTPKSTIIEIPERVVSADKSCADSSLLDSSESVTTKPLSFGFPTSSWKQFWILMKRTFRSILRDQTLTHLRLTSHAIVGLLIGLLYYDIGNDAAKVMSNAGCVFFTVMFTMFTAMMPTILTFPAEMSVFVREHLNYWYSLKSFYLAKTMADLPFQIIFSGIFVVIVYFMTGQPMETERVLMFTAINILTALVAQSLGLLIGAGMRIETGVYIGPITTIPVVLFSGFFVNFSAIPDYLQWMAYLSYVRYGFEGSMLAVYGFERKKLNCSTSYCHFRNPHKFLQEMSMEKANFWVDAAALAFLFVFIRMIAVLVLRFKLKMMK